MRVCFEIRIVRGCHGNREKRELRSQFSKQEKHREKYVLYIEFTTNTGKM